MSSAISYDRYPDCPRSQPPLAAEDNFNPEHAQEALCPAQSARECAGLFGQPNRLVPTYRKSDALPVHCALSAMISRTRAATGSTSMMFSIAARQLIE
jgi:hypothetical protein